MSRIRTIKPDTFRSETLSEVSLAAERTFIGLWTEVDDEGRIKERPAVLNGALWSLRPEHGVREMEHDLDELIERRLICRYEAAGTKYLHVPSWREHQRINRPTKSKLPACPTCTIERGGSMSGPHYPATPPAAGTLFEGQGATVTQFPAYAER